MVADLAKQGPTFSGKKVEYLMFKQAMRAFLERNTADEKVAVGVMNACLTDEAKMYMGSLGDAMPKTTLGLWAVLDGEYKEADELRMQTFLDLR